MSGIFGWVNQAGQVDFASQLHNMKSRGPDETWVWSDKEVSFGVKRLSISEPRLTTSPDPGDTTIVLFDGEIWNRIQLGRQLNTEAHITDTDLVRCCYAEWGSQFHRRIRGIYAIALYDSTVSRLLLVRDPAGVKPLYVTESVSQGLGFASDLRSLCTEPAFLKEPNPAFLNNLASYGFTSTTELPIQNTTSLGPGDVLEIDVPTRQRRSWVDDRALTPSQIISLSTRRHQPYDHHLLIATLTETLIDQTVHRGNGPLGLLFSGGLDSTLLLLVLRDLIPPQDLILITAGHDTSEDVYWAKYWAKALDHPLVRVPFGVPPAFDDCELWAASTYSAALYLRMFSYVKPRFPELKVILSGEGADELFGGYAWYMQPEARLNAFSQALDSSTNTDLGESIRQVLLARSELRSRTCLRAIDLGLGLSDQHLLPLNHGSMAFGIEARVPYLDSRIVEEVLPCTLEGDGELRKMAIRSAITEIAPDAPIQFLTRRKLGLPAASSAMPRSAGLSVLSPLAMRASRQESSAAFQRHQLLLLASDPHEE